MPYTRRYFRPSQAQDLYGISRTTLYRWLKDDSIRTLKQGNCRMIEVASFEQYLEKSDVEVGD